MCEHVWECIYLRIHWWTKEKIVRKKNNMLKLMTCGRKSKLLSACCLFFRFCRIYSLYRIHKNRLTKKQLAMSFLASAYLLVSFLVCVFCAFYIAFGNVWALIWNLLPFQLDKEIWSMPLYRKIRIYKKTIWCTGYTLQPQP